MIRNHQPVEYASWHFYNRNLHVIYVMYVENFLFIYYLQQITVIIYILNVIYVLIFYLPNSDCG